MAKDLALKLGLPEKVIKDTIRWLFNYIVEALSNDYAVDLKPICYMHTHATRRKRNLDTNPKTKDIRYVSQKVAIAWDTTMIFKVNEANGSGLNFKMRPYNYQHLVTAAVTGPYKEFYRSKIFQDHLSLYPFERVQVRPAILEY